MGAGTPRPGPILSSEKRQASDPSNALSQHEAFATVRTPAQRLIEQYERLNTPPLQTPSPVLREKSTYRRQYVYDYNRGHNVAASSLETPEDRDKITWKKTHGFNVGPNGHLKKDKSPIRQSLRNLLSVFKKGKGAAGLPKRKVEDKDASLPPLPESEACDARDSKEENIPPSQLSGPSESNTNTSRPRKKMTGSLLYLSRGPQFLSPGSPGPLIWETCSVTLDGNKLVVSSFTGEMEMSLHEIILSQCTDIRSLSASQLSAEEARVLDQVLDGEKMKVFEVLFQGRPGEKFAAKSVRERAGWISAIWDAILPNQDSKGANNTSSSSKPISKPQVNDQAPKVKMVPVQSPRPTPLPQLSSLLNTSYSDRSLPPLPVKSDLPNVPPLDVPETKVKKPPSLHLDLSEFKGPISPSIYPPTSCALFSTKSPDENLAIPQQLLRVDTSVTSVRKRGGGTSSVVISPSIYPPTMDSRPTSTSAISPVSSTPGFMRSSSPSITNLSQLSVVRQRLAQIERNHSQLSSGSGFSGMSARMSTPSPVSPAGSGWSKREAIFHNAATRGSRSCHSSATTPIAKGALSPFSSEESRRKAERTNLPSRSPQTSDQDPPSSREMNGSQRREERKLHSTPEKPQASKDDVKKVSKELANIKSVLGGESGYPTIHQMVLSLEHRTQGEKKSLRTIQDTLSVLGERVTEAIAAAHASTEAVSNANLSKPDPPPPKNDDNSVIEGLKELKDLLMAELPALAINLQSIKEAQQKDAPVTYNNIGRSLSPRSGDSKSVDLQPVLARLEEIRVLCQTPSTNSDDEKSSNSDDCKLSERFEKVITLINDGSNKQILLAQQQADSVRYLNELNTWLEAFVNNGTSQIQNISANIDRLCTEMGCNTAPPGAFGAQDGLQSNLMNDIRQLVVGMQARDQNFAGLQTAVHSLLEVLTASQTQKGADSQAIAGLMDRQRHDQEVLFRAFTNEISGEIKGERLRFVEAMKEATAINVQLHVEQFKQELSREVMSMTEEVGRLHREKQLVENQISDLFSFYSKHKQSEMPLQTMQSNVGVPPGRHTQERPLANIPRSRHRPLPYPHQS
ncbi:hypothetical protein GALMADRAFT_249068 [Galerina marginata CBS 339.88]|uniref:PH domain-containing protein n=1 Tax=Galerina marginata (strain CBS 339.88) TaxID=685588 RepID=A0A067T5E4_GALM3|nr:hypothetical protein GALMADRAFT_249068 [Galerina marginata CBS 339.88]